MRKKYARAHTHKTTPVYTLMKTDGLYLTKGKKGHENFSHKIVGIRNKPLFNMSQTRIESERAERERDRERDWRRVCRIEKNLYTARKGKENVLKVRRASFSRQYFFILITARTL